MLAENRAAALPGQRSRQGSGPVPVALPFFYLAVLRDGTALRLSVYCAAQSEYCLVIPCAQSRAICKLPRIPAVVVVSLWEIP